MRTMIVPCAGNKKLGGRPIFLNRHPDGEILAIRTIEGVFPETYDRIVYAISKETEDNYDASRLIIAENNGRYPVDCVVLDEETTGPAMTVFCAINKARISGSIAVRDSHAYLELAENAYGNFVAGLDLTKYKKTINNLRDKSFIILNEQKNTLDVVEKHFCSDVISAGLYGFMKADDFIMAYNHLNDPNYPIEKMYVSHIISYLIGYKKSVFHSVGVSKYEDWSSESTWQKVQKEYSNCFLDLDGICRNGCAPTQKTIERLQKLSKAGTVFIAYTYKNNDDGITELLLNKGINVIYTIYECNFTKINKIARTETDIKEMALEL